MADSLGGHCAKVEDAFTLLSRKWAGLILFALSSGERRFCELEIAIPGISARLLSQRVRELEAFGLVRRDVRSSSPRSVSYSLSESGQTLAPIVRELAAWAERGP